MIPTHVPNGPCPHRDQGPIGRHFLMNRNNI
jgi:hypothetical protein